MINAIQTPSVTRAVSYAPPPLAPPAALPPPIWRVVRALVELHQGDTRGAREEAARLRDLCRLVCEVHRIEIEVRGELPEAPAIVVANHLGYIDPIVLCSLLPLSPIAKCEIADWALVGASLERLNVSFVRRGDAWSGARVLLRSLRALERGVGVLNFPEGTTSRGGLLPFHLGAFWLSLRAGVPVLPVSIDFEDLALCWVDREAFLPHYARVWWAGGPHRVRVSIGAPLAPQDYRSVLDLSWAAQRAIANGRWPYSRHAGP